MLLSCVDDLEPFHVLGVAVTPLFGPLELTYPDLDRDEFEAAMGRRSAAARRSNHQGVVVHEPAGHHLRPHFHRVPQFQVFHAGHGRLGRHCVGPGSVHYSDGLTPYGPIIAGDKGLAYAVLRPGPDVGARWMPESRQEVPRGNRRQFSVRVDLGAAGTADGRPRTLERAHDGHPASVVHLGLAAGQQVVVDPAVDRERTVTLIALVRGSLIHPVAATSPAYGSLDAGPNPMRAGTNGADVLLLRTPQVTPQVRRGTP